MARKNGGNTVQATKKDEPLKDQLFAQLLENKKIKSEAEDYRTLYENLCGQTEEKNKQSEKSNSDQQNIIIYLQSQIIELRQKIKKIEEYNAELVKGIKKTKTTNEEKILNIKKENFEETSKLQHTIDEQKLKLTGIHSFVETKEEIENELSVCRLMLENEKQLREARESELERKFLVEREKLKKEMLKKIRETKLKLLKMTEDQLNTTTKRTILENEQMTIELQYQSKEAEKLLRELEKTREENLRMKQDIRLHESTEKQMAKRTHFLSKLVEQLTAKISKLEVEYSNAEDELANNQMEAERKFMQHQLRQAKEEVYMEAEKTVKECHKEITKLSKEARYYQTQCKKFLEMQDDTIMFTWKCLEDARKEMGDIKTNSSRKKDYPIVKIVEFEEENDTTLRPVSELSIQQREKLLSLLFNKLNGVNTGHNFLQYCVTSEREMKTTTSTKPEFKARKQKSSIGNILKRASTRNSVAFRKRQASTTI